MSTQTKLIKNSRTVKFPRVTRSVKSALERAGNMAKAQKWNKVVVIGTGTQGGHYFTSALNDHDIRGMLDDLRHIINTDRLG